MMKNKWGMLNGEWGKTPALALRASVPHSPFPIPHSARRAVTLIELLIGMVIVAILAAAILGTAAAAMEAGRRSRTQSTITKIHNLIMDRLSEYETRRIELDQAAYDRSNSAASNPNDPARGKQLALERLYGLRELMKYEMPDRREDFAINSVVAPPINLLRPPALAQAYHRRYTAAMSVDNDAAECLYMVLMLATGDGEARTLFREQEIGDTDNDGAPEIIDGWGRPIAWMRWPAGFVSDLQPLDANGNRLIDADHDPFDVYRVDPIAYRLVPLIYSAGPDGLSAMRRLKSEDARANPFNPYFAAADNYQNGAIDPAERNATLDNIHNHYVKY